MSDASKITKEEFLTRFKAHMQKMAGFVAFDDGTLVADYADEIGPSYWEDFPDETPEDSAESDMDYWGEE